MVQQLKPGGIFLLNCSWKPEELKDFLPGSMKRYLAENKIRFYIVDAYTLAEELGLGNHINLILQAAFFKLSNIMPLDDAILHMKEAAKRLMRKRDRTL